MVLGVNIEANGECTAVRVSRRGNRILMGKTALHMHYDNKDGIMLWSPHPRAHFMDNPKADNVCCTLPFPFSCYIYPAPLIVLRTDRDLSVTELMAHFESCARVNERVRKPLIVHDVQPITSVPELFEDDEEDFEEEDYESDGSNDECGNESSDFEEDCAD